MADAHEEKVWHLPYTAEQIQASIGKGPILSDPDDNGDCYWMVWDIALMKYVSTGHIGFMGDIDEVATNATKAEQAATNAAKSEENAAQSAELAKKYAEESTAGGGSTPWVASDIYLYVTGRHPFLSSYAYNDFTSVLSSSSN